MPRTALKKTDSDQVDLLRRSPIHDLVAIENQEIDLEKIDEDPTNPGTDKLSLRYKRRMPDIRDSFDIIGRAVYPPVVCQSATSERYITIDGHGRLHEAKRRGQKTIRCIVFPQLTLEQRICLREVLNAAQEPFDTPLVLKDLSLLAGERGLDIRNDDDVDSLLSDFPAKIRKQREKLKLLAKWPSDLADKVAVDEDPTAGVIGIDKVKELNSFVSAIQNSHPQIAKAFTGDQLHKQALKLYFDGRFRDGRRTQDTIRDARRLLKKLPQDHDAADRFVKGKTDFNEFKADAERGLPDRPGKHGVVGLCKELAALLTDIDASNLTADERRSLKRTAELASQVLSEI